MTEHYFSDSPTGPERRREITIALFGRTVTVETANGVFAGDGLFPTGAPPCCCARYRPRADHHAILDLGCGWGPIALGLALTCPGAVIDAVDVNDRALALCRDNADRLQVGRQVRVHRPDQVPRDTTYDQLWSNPPIRIGKAGASRAAAHLVGPTGADRGGTSGGREELRGRHPGRLADRAGLQLRAHRERPRGSATAGPPGG